MKSNHGHRLCTVAWNTDSVTTNSGNKPFVWEPSLVKDYALMHITPSIPSIPTHTTVLYTLLAGGSHTAWDNGSCQHQRWPKVPRSSGFQNEPTISLVRNTPHPPPTKNKPQWRSKNDWQPHLMMVNYICTSNIHLYQHSHAHDAIITVHVLFN